MFFVGREIAWQRIGIDHQILHPIPKRGATSLCRGTHTMSSEPLTYNIRFGNVAGARLARDLKKKGVGQLYGQCFHLHSVIRLRH